MSISYPRLVVLSSAQVDHKKHLCRPITGWGLQGVPYVAVATGFAGGAFVTATRSEAGRAADEALITEATKSTRAQRWSWDVAEQSGFLFWKRPSLLRGMGDPMVPIPEMTTDGGGIDDLATELALIPDAMREACATLKTDTLFVVVPKRGWLLVSRGQLGNPFAPEPMHQAASGIASRAGRSVVAGNVVLLWKDGHMAGVFGRDGSEHWTSLQGEEESTWWPEEK